ncbi:MAG: ribonuclease E/G [Eubacterium sp.]|nr:ribonuclease E/G [Eubacterium sp.]
MNHRKQIVITTIQGNKILFYMIGDLIYDILVEDTREQDFHVGDIYVGKIQNIVDNIDAAFVEISKNTVCYMNIAKCPSKKLHCGQEIIVQVKKTAVKTKQAVVSDTLELAGRYVVIDASGTGTHISKKITDESSLDRLQHLADQIDFCPYAVIFRTNAMDADDEVILDEIQRLCKELSEIQKKGATRKAYSVLHQSEPFYMEYINGCQADNYDRIITDDASIYDSLKKADIPGAEFYSDVQYPLDSLLGLSNKIKKMMDKRVWLKSGGNIIIEPTEALTVIDVNTGKAIQGKRQRETTFYKINVEAAIEAARQIRARNISGIILIDFIDMQDKENEEKLMALFREELKKDKIKTTVIDITKLGLLELTRMKKNPPLWEMLE